MNFTTHEAYDTWWKLSVGLRSPQWGGSKEYREADAQTPGQWCGGLHKVQEGTVIHKIRIRFVAKSMDGVFVEGKGKFRRHKITLARETAYKNMGIPVTGLKTLRRTSRCGSLTAPK